MKSLYIAKIDTSYSLDIGVSKKIYGQIKAFNHIGINMDYLHLDGKNICFNNEKIKPIGFKYFAFKDFYNFLKKRNLQYDFIYIRYAKGNINFYRLCKMLYNNKIKVIVEIPTYPYLCETNYKNIRDLISLLLDKIITPKLYKYIYKIVTTNSLSEIFNINTIQINNGIDLNKFPIVKKENKVNSINLVGIGNLAKWHGYDRVINGLYQYYSKGEINVDVHFYIIGEGKEKDSLVELTKKLNIEKYVHCIGAKNGKELDEIFNKMDIGVSSLALFRAGGGHDPIKSKEFIARGIPVILGYEDKLIDMKLPYVFHVEENETPVNINKVIEQYKNNNITSEQIRDYAERCLSWDSQMKKVINAL